MDDLISEQHCWVPCLLRLVVWEWILMLLYLTLSSRCIPAEGKRHTGRDREMEGEIRGREREREQVECSERAKPTQCQTQPHIVLPTDYHYTHTSTYNVVKATRLQMHLVIVTSLGSNLKILVSDCYHCMSKALSVLSSIFTNNI